MFRQIGHKVIAVFGSISVISMLVLIGFYNHQQETNILLHNERTMGKLTESAIQGLQAVMLGGYADIASNYAEHLTHVEDLEEFIILRTNGQQAFLDNKTLDDVNRRLGDEEFYPKDDISSLQVLPEDDKHLAKTLQTQETSYYYETDAEGIQHLSFLAPITNAEDCQRCHGSQDEIRGVVKLTTSMAPIKLSIQESRADSIKVMIIMLLASMFVGVFLIKRSIVRPISVLTAAMSKISSGDLRFKIPVHGRDELSKMANSFNQMSSQLVDTYEGLRSEQDKLSTIILSSHEGIVVTNGSNDVVLINPAAELLLDKTRQQLNDDGFLHLFDDPDLIINELKKTEHDIATTIEYKGKTLQLLASSIYSDKGEHIGSSALFRDITEEKRLENSLRQISITDALTGLHNRRHLDEIMAKELNRAQRYNTELSVLMFDVDHFKIFNDTHGHDQGDRVLQALADTIRACVRDTDYPCRFGGEEFMIILPSTELEGACVSAERIRSQVEQTLVDGLQVKISIGVLSYQEHRPDDPAQLLEMVDTALYVAKEGGRNCVRIAKAVELDEA